MNPNQDTSTRRVILNMLKTKGALSVSEMAKQLSITEMAIRRHLNTLERDGLIASTLIRQAIGRPTNLYKLTEMADDLFPKNYRQLTLDLLQELGEEGQHKISILFKRRKAKLLKKYSPRMKGKTFSERIKELSKIQDDNGHMVKWEQVKDRSYVIKEYNCPISQIAYQYNQACDCELSLFKVLLETETIEQTECLAKGGEKCEYFISSSKIPSKVTVHS